MARMFWCLAALAAAIQSGVQSFECPVKTTPSLIPDPDDCRKYYHCLPDGRVFEMHCPNNLVFDQRQKICIWDSNARSCAPEYALEPVKQWNSRDSNSDDSDSDNSRSGLPKPSKSRNNNRSRSKTKDKTNRKANRRAQGQEPSKRKQTPNRSRGQNDDRKPLPTKRWRNARPRRTTTTTTTTTTTPRPTTTTTTPTTTTTTTAAATTTTTTTTTPTTTTTTTASTSFALGRQTSEVRPKEKMAPGGVNLIGNILATLGFDVASNDEIERAKKSLDLMGDVPVNNKLFDDVIPPWETTPTAKPGDVPSKRPLDLKRRASRRQRRSPGENLVVDSIQCPSGYSYVPDPTNCNIFYHCYNWQPMMKRCPPGLFYDDQTYICNWPHNVNCIEGYRAKSRHSFNDIRVTNVKGRRRDDRTTAPPAVEKKQKKMRKSWKRTNRRTKTTTTTTTTTTRVPPTTFFISPSPQRFRNDIDFRFSDSTPAADDLFPTSPTSASPFESSAPPDTPTLSGDDWNEPSFPTSQVENSLQPEQQPKTGTQRVVSPKHNPLRSSRDRKRLSSSLSQNPTSTTSLQPTFETEGVPALNRLPADQSLNNLFNNPSPSSTASPVTSSTEEANVALNPKHQNADNLDNALEADFDDSQQPFITRRPAMDSKTTSKEDSNPARKTVDRVQNRYSRLSPGPTSLPGGGRTDGSLLRTFGTDFLHTGFGGNNLRPEPYASEVKLDASKAVKHEAGQIVTAATQTTPAPSTKAAGMNTSSKEDASTEKVLNVSLESPTSTKASNLGSNTSDLKTTVLADVTNTTSTGTTTATATTTTTAATTAAPQSASSPAQPRQSDERASPATNGPASATSTTPTADEATTSSVSSEDPPTSNTSTPSSSTTTTSTASSSSSSTSTTTTTTSSSTTDTVSQTTTPWHKSRAAAKVPFYARRTAGSNPASWFSEERRPPAVNTAFRRGSRLRARTRTSRARARAGAAASSPFTQPSMAASRLHVPSRQQFKSRAEPSGRADSPEDVRIEKFMIKLLNDAMKTKHVVSRDASHPPAEDATAVTTDTSDDNNNNGSDTWRKTYEDSPDGRRKEAEDTGVKVEVGQPETKTPPSLLVEVDFGTTKNHNDMRVSGKVITNMAASKSTSARPDVTITSSNHHHYHDSDSSDNDIFRTEGLIIKDYKSLSFSATKPAQRKGSSDNLVVMETKTADKVFDKRLVLEAESQKNGKGDKPGLSLNDDVDFSGDADWDIPQIQAFSALEGLVKDHDNPAPRPSSSSSDSGKQATTEKDNEKPSDKSVETKVEKGNNTASKALENKLTKEGAALTSTSAADKDHNESVAVKTDDKAKPAKIPLSDNTSRADSTTHTTGTETFTDETTGKSSATTPGTTTTSVSSTVRPDCNTTSCPLGDSATQTKSTTDTTESTSTESTQNDSTPATPNVTDPATVTVASDVQPTSSGSSDRNRTDDQAETSTLKAADTYKAKGLVKSEDKDGDGVDVSKDNEVQGSDLDPQDKDTVLEKDGVSSLKHKKKETAKLPEELTSGTEDSDASPVDHQQTSSTERSTNPPQTESDSSLNETKITAFSGKLSTESSAVITAESSGKTITESSGKIITESSANITAESSADITAESSGKIPAESSGKISNESSGNVSAVSTESASNDSSVSSIDLQTPAQIEITKSSSENAIASPQLTVRSDNASFTTNSTDKTTISSRQSTELYRNVTDTPTTTSSVESPTSSNSKQDSRNNTTGVEVAAAVAHHFAIAAKDIAKETTPDGATSPAPAASAVSRNATGIEKPTNASDGPFTPSQTQEANIHTSTSSKTGNVTLTTPLSTSATAANTTTTTSTTISGMVSNDAKKQAANYSVTPSPNGTHADLPEDSEQHPVPYLSDRAKLGAADNTVDDKDEDNVEINDVMPPVAVTQPSMNTSVETTSTDSNHVITDNAVLSEENESTAQRPVITDSEPDVADIKDTANDTTTTTASDNTTELTSTSSNTTTTTTTTATSEDTTTNNNDTTTVKSSGSTAELLAEHADEITTSKDADSTETAVTTTFLASTSNAESNETRRDETVQDQTNLTSAREARTATRHNDSSDVITPRVNGTQADVVSAENDVSTNAASQDTNDVAADLTAANQVVDDDDDEARDDDQPQSGEEEEAVGDVSHGGSDVTTESAASDKTKKSFVSLTDLITWYLKHWRNYSKWRQDQSALPSRPVV